MKIEFLISFRKEDYATMLNHSQDFVVYLATPVDDASLERGSIMYSDLQKVISEYNNKNHPEKEFQLLKTEMTAALLRFSSSKEIGNQMSLARYFQQISNQLVKSPFDWNQFTKKAGKLFTFSNPYPGVRYDFGTNEVSFRQLTTAEFQHETLSRLDRIEELLTTLVNPKN